MPTWRIPCRRCGGHFCGYEAAQLPGPDDWVDAGAIRTLSGRPVDVHSTVACMSCGATGLLAMMTNPLDWVPQQDWDDPSAAR